MRQTIRYFIVLAVFLSVVMCSLSCKKAAVPTEPAPTPTATHTPDISFEYVTKWGSGGTGDGQFSGGLLGISIDNSTGRVFVAGAINDNVQVFESDGTFVKKWGTTGSLDGQFDEVRAILAVSHTAKVYVADKYNCRIQIFDTAGTFIDKWGSSGSADGQFQMPTGICEDAATGNIYVADTSNGIQAFTPAGIFIKRITGTGTPDGVISGTAGISIDAVSRRIYIAEVTAHRIRVFDMDGNQIYKWGTEGYSDGQFKTIADVLYEPVKNRVYVTDLSQDSNGTYLQVFSPDGRFMAKLNGLDSGGEDFQGAAGIAVNRSTGNIYAGGFQQQLLQVFKVIN